MYFENSSLQDGQQAAYFDLNYNYTKHIIDLIREV